MQELDYPLILKMELGDEMDYFNFRITPTKNQQSILLTAASDEQSYYQLVDYLSFQLKNDLYLDNQDTLRCKLFQFARSFDIAPYVDFALGFEKRKNSDRLFVYEDKILNTGVIKMKINQKNINTSPKLKTK